MRPERPDGIAAGLAALSRRDRARILGDARLMRDAEIARLLRAAGRGLARLAGALARPITAAAGATGLPESIGLALLWRREFRRVRAELGCYSERELTADLRLSRSEVPGIAAEAADERVAAFVREHPEHRRAWRSRGREAGFARAGG